MINFKRLKMKTLSDTIWTSALGQSTKVAKGTAQFILPEFSEMRIVHTEIYATKQKLNGYDMIIGGDVLRDLVHYAC